MADDIAIRVEHVSKDFKLAHERSATIKAHFINILKGKRNRTTEVQHALKDISFEVKKGEFFGIVGRNGSGKSTLLKMLAGIYQPNKGTISVSGKLVPFIELGVGFNPELTGRENVYMNGALLNFSEKDVNKFYDEVVEFAELEDFMDKKLKNYSSGMQVRLAFSMAIRAQADILLIDEVLAVGDADFQRKCFNYFKRLKKEHTTVVFVSHDMEAVREYCDRTVLIDESRIVHTGSAEKVALEYIKQFNRQAESAISNSTGMRWGDQGISFETIEVHPNKDNVTIKQVIVANKKIDGFIVGIRIKNSAGKHITGSNTKIEHLSTGKLDKGQKITIQWSFPNTLSDGSYYLDPAIIYDDEITVSDWWDEAVKFKVEKARKLPYPLDPGFEVEII